MSFTISNENIELKLETAGEIYRFSRFDWNGLISSIKYKHIEILGQEKPCFQRNPKKFGRGLHNEFGINTCIGYEDCEVGQWFPKIGTGWLKKNNKPYNFFSEYEIDAIEFTFDKISEDKAIFICNSGVRNGYGYKYTKEIALCENGFTIKYILQNTGEKTLKTEEYVHNFLCINNNRISKRYSLSFPWQAKTSDWKECVDPNKIFNFESNTLHFTGKTNKQFFLGDLSENIKNQQEIESTWKLHYTDASNNTISISEKGNFKMQTMHLWGWKKVISPEIFYEVEVAPNETISWERQYTISM